MSMSCASRRFETRSARWAYVRGFASCLGICCMGISHELGRSSLHVALLTYVNITSFIQSNPKQSVGHPQSNTSDCILGQLFNFFFSCPLPKCQYSSISAPLGTLVLILPFILLIFPSFIKHSQLQNQN
jgi:hypothetical protein